ncbi:MAG: type II secretion system protein [Candidatus Hydrogenedentes bacterium]|nr:type II secretion system protein [Candidatus Hydrogenedentota bacterium]
MRPRNSRYREGSALLAVIVVMIILTILASAFVTLLNRNVTESNRAVNRMENLALAEAGIHKAAAMLRADPNFRGESAFALGKGQVSVEVRQGATADRYDVRSSARQSAEDPAPVTVAAEFALTPAGVRVVRWEEPRR